jgi:hypothetical protein
MNHQTNTHLTCQAFPASQFWQADLLADLLVDLLVAHLEVMEDLLVGLLVGLLVAPKALSEEKEDPLEALLADRRGVMAVQLVGQPEGL